MVRKMAYVGFSYLLGLLFASFFYFEINIIVGAILIIGALIISLFNKKRITVIVCSICFGIGSVFYSLYDYNVYQNIVKYDDFTVKVDGIITEMTDYSGDFSVYTIDGSINNEIYTKIMYLGTSQKCKLGDEFHATGKVKTPENSYTFNSESYYKCKGIYLTMNSAKDITIISADNLKLKRFLLNYREYVYDCMNRYLTTDEFSIAKAMLFGDKSGIEDSTKTLLYRAGIGHIMAVSGVHISVVCSIIWLVLSAAPINKFVKFSLLVIFIVFFIILSGASNSVLRAAFMLILVYGSSLFNRRSDVMNSLGIAAIVLSLQCPFVIRDASFLLSFTGVIGISVVGPSVVELIENRIKLKNYMRLFVISACISAVIFPVSFLFFDEISVFSPVSNLILMPFCTVILLCGVIISCTGCVSIIAYPLMKLCGICCEIVLGLATTIGKIHIAYIPLGYEFTDELVIAGLIVTVIMLIFIKKNNLKITAAVTVFSLCIAVIWSYRFIPSDHLSAAILHNGKGASAIVIHNNKSASVIDLHKGGKTSEEIQKYLNRIGIFKIDLLAMTVDDITSSVIYRDKLQLFEVANVLLPEKNFTDENVLRFAENVNYYDNTRECVIQMPEYTLLLAENNTVYIETDKQTILAYNGKTDAGITGDYDVVIEYAGEKPAKFVNGEYYIILENDNNKISSVKNYYGDMVIVKMNADKTETEVISLG